MVDNVFFILDIADLSDFSDSDSDTTIVPDGVSYFKYDGEYTKFLFYQQL